MTRLQLLTGQGSGETLSKPCEASTTVGLEKIPKLHHLFSAMYESEMAVGVARLHALLERALHRHLRAAVTALSVWVGEQQYRFSPPIQSVQHGYRSHHSRSTAVMTVPTPPAGSALLQASTGRSTPLLDRSFLQVGSIRGITALIVSSETPSSTDRA